MKQDLLYLRSPERWLEFNQCVARDYQGRVVRLRIELLPLQSLANTGPTLSLVCDTLTEHTLVKFEIKGIDPLK